MSDWQVGDLALCVDDSPCTCCGEKTWAVNGAIYSVIDIEVVDDELFLRLAELPAVESANHEDKSWLDAPSFRKIRPDDHEACEQEFVTLLNRLTQPKEAVA